MCREVGRGRGRSRGKERRQRVGVGGAVGVVGAVGVEEAGHTRQELSMEWPWQYSFPPFFTLQVCNMKIAC